MSIELLQPVPDAIGELLEYTDNRCISVRVDLREIQTQTVWLVPQLKC